MSVAFGAIGPSSAGQLSTTSASASWTHTPSGTPTEVLVYLCVGWGSGGTNGVIGSYGSVTYGGTAMTLLGSVASDNGQFGGIFCYGLRNPPTGAQVVSASGYTPPSGVTVNDFEGFSISFTGGGGGFGTPVTGFGSGTAGSVSVTTSDSTGMVCAGACDGSGGETATAGTQRWKADQNQMSGAGNTIGLTAPSNGGTVTLSWSQASDFYGVVAVEVLVAAGTAKSSADSAHGADAGGVAPASPVFKAGLSRLGSQAYIGAGTGSVPVSSADSAHGAESGSVSRGPAGRDFAQAVESAFYYHSGADSAHAAEAARTGVTGADTASGADVPAKAWPAAGDSGKAADVPARAWPSGADTAHAGEAVLPLARSSADSAAAAEAFPDEIGIWTYLPGSIRLRGARAEVVATDERTGEEFTVARVYWVDRSLLELGQVISESRAVRRITSSDAAGSAEAVVRAPVAVSCWVQPAVGVQITAG